MASATQRRVESDRERRRCSRTPARLRFDLYAGGGRLGSFWSSNVSQEGLFIETTSPVAFDAGIVALRFQERDASYDLRGRVVYRVPGEGIGVQLAYWRNGDRPAHQAYLRAIS